MNALFNDKGIFLGYSNIIPPNIKKIKKLGDDFDSSKFFWDGDYYTGKLLPIENKKYNEFDFETQFIDRIKALHSSEISHLLCIKQLYILAQKNDCIDSDFENMCIEILPLFDFYNKTINSLKEKEMLETKKEIYEKHKELF
jgi:hypothetical protein